MTIGATQVIEKYGSRLATAEAYILGETEPWQEDYVLEVIGSVIVLEAARIRLEAKGKLKEIS